MKREVRYSEGIELRQSAAGRPLLCGYAATWRTQSHPIWGLVGKIFKRFVERILPGAFSRSIVEDDVIATVGHDADKIIGRKAAGTLTLREDNKGLYCEIQPPDTTVGRDVVESVRRGDLNGMSFAFYDPEDSWSATDDGSDLRELRSLRLVDVSVVATPAYPQTSIALRSLLFPDGLPSHLQKRTAQPDHAAQQPSRSNPYAWMSADLQKFYLRQDRLHKLDKELALVPTNSVLGRKLKIERELAEIEQDRALDENRRMKSELDERWARKDPCAAWPVWRDPNLYAKKNEKQSEKDPWATRRLF